MIYWRIWVRDLRTIPLERDLVREVIEVALEQRNLKVDRGPSVVFSKSGELLGEWAFSLSDPMNHDALLLQEVLDEVLRRRSFTLRQPAERLNKPAGESTLRRLPVVRSSRA